jgi:hypothetical protein
MNMSPIRRSLPVILLLLTLIFAAQASADPVVVGSPLTNAFKPSELGERSSSEPELGEETEGDAAIGDVANTKLGEPGANVLSPVTGTITSWRLVDAAGGPFRLRVLRPLGNGTLGLGVVPPLALGLYVGVGTSAPETPTSYDLQSFPTSVPIQAGDLVAVENTNSTDQLGFAFGTPGSDVSLWVPPPREGEARLGIQEEEEHTINGEKLVGIEVGFDAIVEPTPVPVTPTVVPAPVISSVGPASGSFKGGTKVTITGSGLSGASAVSFGGFAATGLTAVSSTQLQAVVPPLGHPGAVPVSVSTPAGTSAASTAARFTGTACKVPKLRGRTLAGARKVLRKRDCRIGPVTHKTVGRRGSGRVLHQRSGAGKNLAPGTKVKLVVGQHKSH